MVIMAGNMAEPSRPGAGEAAESLHLDPQTQGRETLGKPWALETSKLVPSDTLPLRSHLT